MFCNYSLTAPRGGGYYLVVMGNKRKRFLDFSVANPPQLRWSDYYYINFKIIPAGMRI